VGTYEARPGAGAGDYTNPSPDHRAGSYQGDGPMGTLTSEMFTIGGDDKEEVCEVLINSREFDSASLVLALLLFVVAASPKHHFNRQENHPRNPATTFTWQGKFPLLFNQRRRSRWLRVL